MDVLIRFGFTIDEIKNMMDTNDLIEGIEDKEIYNLIDILKKVGCTESHIKNIFLCNPFYLSRGVNEVNDLIKKLYEIGFSNLYLLFDSNPYILNLSDEEIENLYELKIAEGLKKEEFIDFINYNTIL